MKMTDAHAVRRLPVCLLSIEDTCSRATVSCWSGGSVFYGQYLHVTDSGTKEAPIVIGAYGTADAPPRIDACGQGIWYQDYGTPLDAPTHVYHGYVSSAVLLYDAEHIVVEEDHE